MTYREELEEFAQDLRSLLAVSGCMDCDISLRQSPDYAPKEYLVIKGRGHHFEVWKSANAPSWMVMDRNQGNWLFEEGCGPPHANPQELILPLAALLVAGERPCLR